MTSLFVSGENLREFLDTSLQSPAATAPDMGNEPALVCCVVLILPHPQTRCLYFLLELYIPPITLHAWQLSNYAIAAVTNKHKFSG